ncbi:Uncharacterised protein [Mycobacteroides abscessus subsp. massiliense]|nr:Uncharacterised protein [Mycobacteroides abscessus subsp. massiliense]
MKRGPEALRIGLLPEILDIGDCVDGKAVHLAVVAAVYGSVRRFGVRAQPGRTVDGGEPGNLIRIAEL